MLELVTEVLVLPDGMEIDDDERRDFALTVRWRGPRGDTGRGGYAVMHGNRHVSRKGNWRYEPEPHLQRHYRWENLDDAIALARSIVNTVKVHGRTWAEWGQWRGERREAGE